MNEENVLICEYCGDVFPTERDLNIHKAKSHASKEVEKGRYPCSRCGQVLDSPEDQAEHMRSEHPEVVRRIHLVFWAITIVAILFVLWQFLP